MTNALPVDLPAVIRAALMGDAAIQEIIDGQVMVLGTFTKYRVPCVILKLTGGETNLSFDGVEEEQYPLARMEVYHNDYTKGRQLFDMIVSRLIGLQQVVIAGHLVAAVQCSQPDDSDEPLLVGQTLPDFVFGTNVQAWLTRAISEES